MEYVLEKHSENVGLIQCLVNWKHKGTRHTLENQMHEYVAFAEGPSLTAGVTLTPTLIPSLMERLHRIRTKTNVHGRDQTTRRDLCTEREAFLSASPLSVP